MGWQGYFEDTWIGTLNEYYKNVFFTLGFSFPRGLIFFLAGYYTHRLLRFSTFVWVLAVIVSTVMLGVETRYVISAHYTESAIAMFSQPLLIGSCMMLIVKLCRNTPYVKVGKLMRRFSTFLYLSNLMIIILLHHYIGRFFGVPCILACCATSFILFLLHDKLQTRKYFRWLRYAC